MLCDRQGFRQSHALGVLLGIVLARPVQCLAEVLDAPGGRRGRLDGGGRRFGRRMQFSNGRRRLLHLAARRGLVSSSIAARQHEIVARGISGGALVGLSGLGRGALPATAAA